MRQVPSSSSTAWLFDLGSFRGPFILVLRDLEDEARGRLAEHFVDLDLAGDVPDAFEMLRDVVSEPAGVLW